MCNDMCIEKLTSRTCETLLRHAKVGRLSAAGTSQVLSRDAVTSLEISRVQAFNWSIALVACCHFKVFGFPARLFAEIFPKSFVPVREMKACLIQLQTAGTIA